MYIKSKQILVEEHIISICCVNDMGQLSPVAPEKIGLQKSPQRNCPGKFIEL